ncbi:hypothetical protein [Micromonospora sp. NPDC007230]|uniref:hypothetical protein n=1 Tax=Micromonospora sp. NPDC007230 TaxID=3364237 RepID=UPI0036CC650E
MSADIQVLSRRAVLGDESLNDLDIREIDTPYLPRTHIGRSAFISELGWQIGPDQRFQKFGVGRSDYWSVFALVRHIPDSSGVQAYVYAFHGV